MKKSIYILLTLGALLCACTDEKSPYDASGVFETTEVVVSAEVAGQIERLAVDEGQEIVAGTGVGYIDTMQYSLQKRQLRANAAADDSRRLNESTQTASIRQQIENLNREKKRYQAMVAENSAAQKQVDEIDYQIKVLEKQIGATTEQISTTNRSISERNRGVTSQIAQLNDHIRNSVIRTPITGTVLAKYAEPGEYATPGKALFKMADVGAMKLRAYITADQLTRVKIGQQVKVYADQGTTERKEYTGTVTWIADKAEFTPKTIQTRDERANLVYAIKISVTNDGLIKRGMYGDVKF